MAMPDNYDDIMRFASEYASAPYTLCVGTDVIAVFCRHVITKEQEFALNTLCKTWKCKSCTDRLKNFVCLSGQHGRLMGREMQEILRGCNCPADARTFANICELSEEICRQRVISLSIQEGSFVDNHLLISGGFHHITCDIPESFRTNIHSEEPGEEKEATTDLELIGKAFHRYLPEMLPKLISNLFTHGVVEAIESLELMKLCLAKAAYGNKFQPTVDWLLRIAQHVRATKPMEHMNHSEKYVFYAQILLWGPIRKDNQDALAYFYHTANNNIIDLLNKAESIDEMTALIQERLSPENYQRRDPNAEISDGQIREAERRLGEFSNSVMTVEYARATIPQIIALKIVESDKNDKNSSMHAFAQMKQKSSGSFAARCGSDAKKREIEAKKREIEAIRTIRELLEYLRSHPETLLELDAGNLRISYAATSTLAREKLKHPHLWAFLGTTGSSCNLDNYVRITNILPMFEYIAGGKNILFVPENVKIDRSEVPNCCFPQFLEASYTRTCGPAFEGINSLIKITVPDEPIMFGVGTSSVDDIGTLASKLNFKVDGIPISICKL